MSQTTAETRSNGTSSSQQPELDIVKLHSLPSEQQDLCLLNFCADLAQQVDSLDKDAISAHQAHYKKEILKVISLPSPPPTRVIRKNLGRSFAGLFEKGDRRLLYETINELLGILNAAKGERALITKHAVVQCLGDIFEAAGDGAISLSGLTCLSMLRLYKAAQSNAGLRSSILEALGKIFGRIGKSVDETLAKDLWKLARTATSSEKAYLVQKSALRCLEQLVSSTTWFENTSDFQSIKSTIFKAFDSSSAKVRHAAASTLASILVKSFSGEVSTVSASKTKKSKKLNKKEPTVTDGGEEIQGPESPVPKKNSVQAALGLTDLLKQISAQYVRTSTSNRARAGLAVCYIRLLKNLDRSFVEANYMVIADHIFTYLLGHPTIYSSRYRLLMTKKFVRVILEDVIGRQILGETAKLNAARALINNVLKNYPQALRERPEPSKHTIVGALSALTSLLDSLESASNSIADSCQDGLLQVLQHPSYTVQISTSHCMRRFVLVCPQQLLPCASLCLNSLQREINFLKTPRHSPRRCVGYANGLAAVLSTSPDRPIYGSMDLNMRVLSLANELLKSSGESELRASATQIQVAWILMGGLMAFGPLFIKPILPQLLFLWKNALPKPESKESLGRRNLLELSFLTHVRECSLGCMLAFLELNNKILTSDLVRRMAALLQNTTIFLNHLPSKKNTDDISERLSPSLQLYDLERVVRRRVLQLYTALLNQSPTGAREVLLQPDILTLSVSLFAHPEDYASASLSTSIANSAGSFESVWEVGDNYGFGVTGLLKGLELSSGLEVGEMGGQCHWLTGKGADTTIDRMLLSPMVGAREHDSVSLYVPSIVESDGLPDPPATEVVNSAIKLFAISLPLQSATIQESILEQLVTFMSTTSLHRDPGRKAAISVNVAVALLITLKVAVKETISAPGDLTAAPVQRILHELLWGLILHPDLFVRNVAGEALGRLCSSAGNTFTSNEINQVIDLIVSNREPNARAGCSVALGCIYSQIGGMAAGHHVKTIFGVLLSLSDDPHPLVHFWALEGLQKVVESAGLSFAGFVSSTLGMLAQRYVADTHNEEISSLPSSNLEFEFPTPAVIARCLDSLINVLGPDLSDAKKVRELILVLIAQLQKEDDPLVLVATMRCLEHISIYAVEHMDYSAYARNLQSYLGSSRIDVRDAAVDGLYNLIKLDAGRVIGSMQDGFEDQIWIALDSTPDDSGLQNAIRSWLSQTCLASTASWIQRIQKVMNQTRPKSSPAPTTVNTNPATAAPDLQDEEVAGFAASSTNDQETSAVTTGMEQELLKWQVRAFAMECLSEMLATVGKEMASSSEATPAGMTLQEKVADVIRTAFSASTSNVVDLRIWGLRIIDQTLKMFGRTPDPDFSEASLLDQFQAQITSALTPAFGADSSPELASEAVEVCAAFIATGIVKDVDRMGRILRLLVSALEDFSKQSETASIGDLKCLGSNAQMMVKVAVISAWAGLQVASTEQQHLVDVVRPHINILGPLWLSSLREYARLRFAPDSSMNNTSSPLSGEVDITSSDMDRTVLLKFYKDSWLKLMHAISSLIEENIDIVFNALDGRSGDESSRNLTNGSGINYRDEPVAFFFVLFGICFEALLVRSGNDADDTRAEILGILMVIKRLLQPSVSGQAIYQETVFSETMDLLNRLVLTQGMDVQVVIVKIVRDLCLSHPSSRGEQNTSTGGEGLSEDVEQLFELTRIMVMVLTGLLPNLTKARSQVSIPASDEATSLIRTSLEALVTSAEVFPSVIKTDLYACIFHIFSTILGTPICQPTIVPQSLPILKTFIQSIVDTSTHSDNNSIITTQLRSCLKHFLQILSNAQKRETSQSLACVKNALLVSTILVNTASALFPAGDPLINKLIDELIDCLSDRKTTTLATNCIRSLLFTNQPNRNAVDNSIIHHLIPRLLSFLTHPPTTTESNPNNPHQLITHLLTQFTTTSLSPSQIPAMFTILIPALLQYHTTYSSSSPNSTKREIASRLLELAAVNQAAFRDVVARMDTQMKSVLEGVLRSGGDGEDKEDGHGEEEMSAAERERGMAGPSIALKMDFG
ncbi:MAG: hypothetical protein M1816_001191 [Peltula sp. TS41687]|nr:MAG: hypothetical protein M1816_001191 [Peltula sp. TS41687]